MIDYYQIIYSCLNVKKPAQVYEKKGVQSILLCKRPHNFIIWSIDFTHQVNNRLKKSLNKL